MPPGASASQSSFPPGTIDSSALWQQLEAHRPLPLRFALLLSRRPNASLCPCLQVDLPSRDRTFTVTRILDPEHRVPYITLSPIFLAANLTIVQGLLKFEVSPTEFDLSLAGLEPWDDIWISLPLARSIAAQLDLLPALSGILDAKTSTAWSLDEGTEGLSHNWRVPQQWVDAASYSTDAITRPGLRFGRVEMMPRGQVIKTLVSAEMRIDIGRATGETRKKKAFRLHQCLVRWSSRVYRVWVEVRSLLDEGQGETEEGERWREVIRDLAGVVVPPSGTDVLEWSQLVSPEDAQPANGDERILSQVSMQELSDLRANEMTIGEMLLPLAHGADPREVVARLEGILRTRLSLLHRITLLSRPHLSSSSTEDSGSPPCDAESERVVEPQPARQDEGRRAVELEQLHTKLDELSSKVDRFMAQSARPRQVLVPEASSAATSQQIASTVADPPPTLSPTLVEPAPPPLPLPSISTTPSLAIFVMSFFVSLIVIKLSS